MLLIISWHRVILAKYVLNLPRRHQADSANDVIVCQRQINSALKPSLIQL
jgi:hypothetical protein